MTMKLKKKSFKDWRGEEYDVYQYNTFICVHRDRDEPEGENKRKDAAVALMSEVYDILSAETEDLMPRTITHANFLTSAVVSLNVEWMASIESIHSDQWHGVSAHQYKCDTYPIPLHTWIQCDLVEHGIAATVKAYHDFAAGDYEIVEESKEAQQANGEASESGGTTVPGSS